MEAVRDPQRVQLLRGPRELDHPVELGSALTRTPRQAQGNAAEGREAQARTEPESIGTEV